MASACILSILSSRLSVSFGAFLHEPKAINPKIKKVGFISVGI
jgi:hypothetical protein